MCVCGREHARARVCARECCTSVRVCRVRSRLARRTLWPPGAWWMATWGRFRTAGCRLRHMLLRAACCVAATSFPRNALRCGASLERYNPRVAGVRGRREGGRTPTGPSDAPLGARPGCGGRCRSRSGERARARQTRRSARTYRICARHRHGADIASRRALFARGGAGFGDIRIASGSAIGTLAAPPLSHVFVDLRRIDRYTPRRGCALP